MKRSLLLGLALFVVTAVCATAEDAKTLYDKGCAKCHGDDGKGQTKMGQKMGAKDYTDAKVQEALTDEAAFKAIKEGLTSSEGKKLMKPAEGLSDEDINGLVKHMRSFKQ